MNIKQSKFYLYLFLSGVCLLFLAVFLLDSKKTQPSHLELAATPRYLIEDRQWPVIYGEAHISLWKDDKLAVFSLTIDDNTLPDHTFWLELGKQYGWAWTWFVIAEEIRMPPEQHNWWGNWDDWQAILDQGHDVQSHEMTQKGTLGFTQEYQEAITLLNTKLDGVNALTMAYNGSTTNSPETARRFVCAARSTIGSLVSPGKIDFFNIHSISGAKNFFAAENHWASFNGLLNPQNRRKGRAWYVAHFHKMNADSKAYVRRILEYIKVHETDIWVGTFREVALYAQSFSTAEVLNLDTSSNQRISFDLIDRMDDRFYTMPLTVKIRLNDSWNDAEAWQKGISRRVTLLKYQSGRYALVDVVPDQGKLILTKKNGSK